MSTIAMPTSAPIAFEARAPRRSSIFRRAFAAFIESRRASAHRQIAMYLAGLSDARLADLGLTPADVALIRAHRWPAPGRHPADTRSRSHS